jgi:hypothetical protein
MKNPKKVALKPSLARLVSLLSHLEQEGYEVTAEGFCKILLGVLDEETRSLTSLTEFAYLQSLGSKRIKMRLHYLVRLGYVGLDYSSEDQDYYLTLTDKGRAVADPTSIVAKSPSSRPQKRSIRHH